MKALTSGGGSNEMQHDTGVFSGSAGSGTNITLPFKHIVAIVIARKKNPSLTIGSANVVGMAFNPDYTEDILTDSIQTITNSILTVQWESGKFNLVTGAGTTNYYFAIGYN